MSGRALLALALLVAGAACVGHRSGAEARAAADLRPAAGPVPADTAHGEPGPPPSAAERALLAGVSEARAARHVRELVALGPRTGGTPSGDAAAAWLAERFAAAGLAVRVLEDPPRWTHAESAWALRAARRGPGGAREERALASAWPWGFSPAGRGVAPLALAPAPGVALLVTDGPPRTGAGDAAAADGPALVLVDGRTSGDGRWPAIEHLPAGPDNPRPVLGLSTADGAALRAWLAEAERGAAGPVEVAWELDATIARARPRTVVATLPARAGAASGYLLVCAHGDADSGGPGANDNASGVAIVLEIAAAWTAAVRAGAAPPPAREVRFAVWGTEIHSTEAYLRRRVLGEGGGVPEGELLGVVNFDQAGYGHAADQLNVEPDDLPANAELVRTLAAVLAERAGAPGFPPRWATNKSLGGTDSYVFSGSEPFRRDGRPAVTLFTSAWREPAEHPRTPGMPGESWSDRDTVFVDHDPWYHTAGDLPENTTDREPENMGWCARVALLAASRWLAGLE